MSPAPHSFSAEHVVAYDYRRSVGPVLGRFFTALRDGHILGSKAPGGRVLVPPMEHDPETGDALVELVEVGPGVTGYRVGDRVFAPAFMGASASRTPGTRPRSGC